MRSVVEVDLTAAADWSPPSGWDKVMVVDSHAGGEPFRLVVDGVPEIPGRDMIGRRRFAQQNLDHLRKGLMWEPRGHADMYGGWLGPPVSPEADLSVLFTHNEGFSTMCGHGIIALVKVVLDTGIIAAGDEPSRSIGIDTPAGLVTATAHLDRGSVTSVRFRNVPSFVARENLTVDTKNHGAVSCDLAYGGAFYAFVDASAMGLDPVDVATLVSAGREIKGRISETAPPRHPETDDLSFVYGVIFVFPPNSQSHHSRHVCVFADGEVDRSPTGTGVSARLALLHQAGAVSVGAEISIESVVGSVFTGRIVDTTSVDGTPAVIAEIGGTAHITGRSELWFDPDDPLGGGFFIR